MPTVKIETDDDLDELRRAANKLYRRRPCQQRITCLAREMDRPLNAVERDFCHWTERPYESYDPLRLCTSCLQFWLIERAARLENVPGIAPLEKEETRPKLPQKG